MPTKTYPVLDTTGVRIAAALENMAGNVSPLYDHVLDGAGPHNSVYRGKNLGATYTAQMSAAVKAGTFKDLFIGDYFQVGAVTYRIAGFDYFYLCGYENAAPDYGQCKDHHIVLVPDVPLFTHNMNKENTTNGGYTSSLMFTEAIPQANTQVEAAFPGHVLEHYEFLSNAATAGYESGRAWVKVKANLMSEEMLYGGNILSARTTTGDPFIWRHTVTKTQLPLFTFRPDLICNRQTFWLQDICSAIYFANAGSDGLAGCNAASLVLGVRPAFPIS